MRTTLLLLALPACTCTPRTPPSNDGSPAGFEAALEQLAEKGHRVPEGASLPIGAGLPPGLPPGAPLPPGAIGYDRYTFAPILPLLDAEQVVRQECPSLFERPVVLKTAWRDIETKRLRFAYRDGVNFFVSSCNPDPTDEQTLLAWFHIVDAGAPPGRLEQVVDITQSNYDYAAFFWSRHDEPAARQGMSVTYVADENGYPERAWSTVENWSLHLPLVHPMAMDPDQADPVLIVLGPDPD